MLIGVGFAVLKYHLYNIEHLGHRTLIYGARTATLALIYFAGLATTQVVSTHSPAKRSGHNLLSWSPPRHSCPIQPPEASYPVAHRPPLRQKNIRRSQDVEGLLCQAA